MLKLPEEEVLVKHEEEEERDKSEAVDDGRDDRVCYGCGLTDEKREWEDCVNENTPTY